mmetsp:Transcript_35567/g.99432  ORF Transcript_35567/g.99432 Transcript_35567/m.99432 type:complete len:94 (+) Transcript_35567:174-455(+)
MECNKMQHKDTERESERKTSLPAEADTSGQRSGASEPDACERRAIDAWSRLLLRHLWGRCSRRSGILLLHNGRRSRERLLGGPLPSEQLRQLL